MRSSNWVCILSLLTVLLAGSPALAEQPGVAPAQPGIADEGLWFSKEESVRLLQAVQDRQHLEEIVRIQDEKIKALEALVATQDEALKAKDEVARALKELAGVRAEIADVGRREADLLKEEIRQLRRERERATTGAFLKGGGTGFGAGILAVLLLLVLL